MAELRDRALIGLMVFSVARRHAAEGGADGESRQYAHDAAPRPPARGTQSPTRISNRTSYPSCEQHDGGGVEECGCGGDGGLAVLGETAVAPEPGEDTLDDPAAWMHGKADLAGLFAHDLDDDPCGVRHPFGGIGAISEGTFDERIQRAGRP
jgi:hypothetical protein